MEENINQGIQLPVAKIPATEAIKSPVYPLVEEMTFRAIIKCEADGYALLRAVQMMVNELGTETIIAICDKLEKNPKLIQQARSYLPYVLKL